ncbi:MAG: isoprenylcysteine carboxylmethyltransferase family protein [Elusimicrobia bacterium]|nr:isoprenylcysteine carboxylmethyltransferase family protein [Elusimicrobiota bacterium]
MNKIFSFFKASAGFLKRNRVRLSTILVIILLLEDIVEGVVPHDVDGFHDFLGAIGLFFVVCGTFLRSWAAGIISKDKVLSTTGPYALTRHPLYIGSLLMALGFCAIIDDGENILIILLVIFAVYLPKIRDEEKSLAQIFGEEWNRYTRNISGFFPKPADMRSNWSLSQWIRNREHHTFVLALSGLFILELWHEFSRYSVTH